MYLVVDTAKEEIFIGLWGKEWLSNLTFRGSRELNSLILLKLDELLRQQKVEYADLTGVIISAGPGSFTGLRIGFSIANTVAYAGDIPIVAINKPKNIDELLQKGKTMLESMGSHFTIPALPEYGSEPHITEPKKSL